MPFGGAASRVRTRWRSSLYLRVVATTLALSILVVVVLGQILIGRITSGLLDAKQRASLVEAQAGINQAQALITASGDDNPDRNQNLVDDVVVELAPGGQGTPRLYDVLLLSSSTSLLQRGSSTVTEASVPAELREAVADRRRPRPPRSPRSSTATAERRCRGSLSAPR